MLLKGRFAYTLKILFRQMRDVLIHAYFGIDFELVWDTIKDEIPRLKILIGKALGDME